MLNALFPTSGTGSIFLFPVPFAFLWPWLDCGPTSFPGCGKMRDPGNEVDCGLALRKERFGKLLTNKLDKKRETERGNRGRGEEKIN